MLKQITLSMLLFVCTASALTQSKSPGLCVNNDGCAIECTGTIAWSNPSNAKTSNNQYANTTGLGMIAEDPPLDTGTTQYLVCSQYNFTIPAGATINNVYVDIERYRTPNSFPAGTKILTPTGEKNVETLRAGDEVIAYNTTTGETSIAKVIRNPSRNETYIRRIITQFGYIETTDLHPFWTGKEWKNAADLKQGDTLLMATGDLDHVIANTRYEQKTEVWTLAVEAPNTYFARGLLVHNKLLNPDVRDRQFFVSRTQPTDYQPSGYEDPNDWGSIDQARRYTYPPSSVTNTNNANYGVWLRAYNSAGSVTSYGLVDYINITIDYTEASTSSCPATSPATSNTVITCGDNCSNFALNMATYNLTFNGSGTSIINNYNITNFTKATFQGVNSTARCTVTFNNSKFR